MGTENGKGDQFWLSKLFRETNFLLQAKYCTTVSLLLGLNNKHIHLVITIGLRSTYDFMVPTSCLYILSVGFAGVIIFLNKL